MLSSTLNIAAAGMKVQDERLRVVAENIANSDATGRYPGDAPYRRKMVIFQNVLDKELGVDLVKIGKRTFDQSDFVLRLDPSHPAANDEGYVQMPNVNTIIEMADMREARRAYEANLSIVETTRAMTQRTLDLLR